MLGDGKHRVTRAVMRQTHYRLPRRNHLPHLGLDARDHASVAGAQAGITRLVALCLRLGFGLVQRRISGFQAGLAALQLGTADEVLRLQGLKALVFCCGQIALALRRAHLGLCGLSGQLVVLRIDAGQQLASRHALAQLRRAFHQFARHLKPQARLHTRTHLGRILA